MLMKLDNLIEGQVSKRPSKHIKSPYVADIKCKSESDKEILAHSPSLGCCGLADINSHVLLQERKEKSIKCSHVIYLSIVKEKDSEQIVGIHPKLAETLVESALKLNKLTKLQNVKRYKRETSIYIKDKINSRFDFTGVDENGMPFIMEVKNVPLADYEDISIKERNKIDFSDRSIDSKVAYFPDGYRKKSTDTVSPRALKHIKELTIIKTEVPTIRCIMCYVIQRTDVNRFQPSVIDPEYRNAFAIAMNLGVEIITMVVSWNRDGEAIFIRDNLPISI
jgi:DNA-binding sugar fermentation-stimulating protein